MSFSVVSGGRPSQKTKVMPQTSQHSSKESPDFETRENVTRQVKAPKAPESPNEMWHSLWDWKHTRYRLFSDHFRRQTLHRLTYQQWRPTDDKEMCKSVYVKLVNLQSSHEWWFTILRVYPTRPVSPDWPGEWLELPYRNVTLRDTFETHRPQYRKGRKPPGF